LTIKKSHFLMTFYNTADAWLSDIAASAAAVKKINI